MAKRLLRDRRGYALVTVLCILLLFTALGVNALVAANATMGAAAAQQADAQAYTLAVSAVPQAQAWVEGGAFTPLIQAQLLDPVAAAYTEQSLTAFPNRKPPVSARAAGTLLVRVRAAYGGVSCAFVASYAMRYEGDQAQFQQLSVKADRIREGA